MASPAAILSVLVKADGIASVNKQLGGLHTQGKKASGTLDGVETSSKRAHRGLSNAAKAAVGMAGAIGAVSLAKGAVNTTEDLAKTTLLLSKNFGLTTKQASEWAAVAKARGVDGNKLSISFKSLSTAIRGAGEGGKAQIKAFNDLGISQKTLKDHGNDLNYMLSAVSDGLKKLPPGTDRAALQAKLFGRQWQTLSPLLRDGSGALNEQLNSADKLGATFSGKGVKGLEDMVKKQREAKLATLGLQVAFGTQLAPALTAVIEKVVEIIGWFRQHQTLAKALGIAIVALAAGVTVYNVASKVAAVATGAWTAATWLLNTAMKANVFGLVVIAIAALAAGIIYAYRHSATFRKIVNDMWAMLKAVAAWMVTAGVAAFHAVASAVRVSWGVVKTVTEVVWGGIKAFLTVYWDVLRTIITTVFNAYKTIITGTWKVIRTVTEAIWGGIKAFLVGYWSVLRTLVTTYFNAYKAIITGAWRAIKAVTETVWGAIKVAILTPIRAARDLLGGIWGQMKDAAHTAWEKIKTGAGNFAGDLKDTIIKGFEGGVNAVIDFVNKIISVINKIPGIPNIKPIGHVGGGGKGTSGKYRGGPNGTGRLAKGGMVPGSGSGDKVPLHLGGRLAAMVEPGELVSVTNRNATAALMGANSAVPRFAGGGILNTQEMADLWRSKGGSASLADTMGVIGLVESGGNPNARNPSGASGLWQILGQLVPGNIFNPGVNALNAIAKYKSQGLSAWDASKSKWGPLLGKKVGPDLNPLKLLGDLPGIGGLPDWLKGTGKYVLSHVGDWIKDNVAKLIPGGGGGTKGPKGVGTFGGVPMADWVIDALNYGRAHGAYGNPTSGYRPGYDSHTATGASEHQGTQYPHGAVDFGGYHDSRALAEKLSYVHATAGFKYPLLAPKGFVDDGHASGTGHMRGGVLPFVGKFHGGGFADREGLAHVAKGEQIGGPLVHIENVHVGSRTDVNSFAERIAFRVATA